MAAAALGFVAFTSNIFFMDETLPRLQGPGSLLVKYARLGTRERNSTSDDAEGVPISSTALQANGVMHAAGSCPFRHCRLVYVLDHYSRRLGMPLCASMPSASRYLARHRAQSVHHCIRIYLLGLHMIIAALLEVLATSLI